MLLLTPKNNHIKIAILMRFLPIKTGLVSTEIAYYSKHEFRNVILNGQNEAEKGKEAGIGLEIVE